ncbi:amide hydrolase [Bradyrhizobium sp. CCBAU 51745]|nr:amide hydrolase [Bradyrhizobium sp. CCBAU 45384]MDA9443429.1 amide hydrolase [Bradyrhizobium sp. CCBAU 51745]
MRHAALVMMTLLLFSGWARAEPGIEWQFLATGQTQTSPIQGTVESYARKYKPTAIMIVQDGLVVATSGDLTRKVNVRSVRKSFLSALYGIAIERDQIKLEGTLDQLGIDDTSPSLTTGEKQATVRQLLMARSGVYHPAAYETSDQKSNRPPRGSHRPGTFWYYNNWDFNALGAIYERATGSDIFDSFDKMIARPIGMQDFTAHDGAFVGDSSSLYRAYVFSMSARDLARFGLLFLNKGRWNDASVVPSQWTAESTKAYSETDRKDRGYGYLWWTLDAGVWGRDAIFASGYGGQLIVIVPEKRLVAVQLVELDRSQKGIHSATFLDLVRQIVTMAN